MIELVIEKGPLHNFLMCDNCGSQEIHHDQVDVYMRSEDSQTGRHTRVLHTHTVVDSDMQGNPSDRRQGLTLGFLCEHCKYRTFIHILQHKGTTYVKSDSTLAGDCECWQDS